MPAAIGAANAAEPEARITSAAQDERT